MSHTVNALHKSPWYKHTGWLPGIKHQLTYCPPKKLWNIWVLNSGSTLTSNSKHARLIWGCLPQVKKSFYLSWHKHSARGYDTRTVTWYEYNLTCLCGYKLLAIWTPIETCQLQFSEIYRWCNQLRQWLQKGCRKPMLQPWMNAHAVEQHSGHEWEHQNINFNRTKWMKNLKLQLWLIQILN